MSNKLNLLVHLNAYADSNDTNNPSQNNFKWNLDLQGITVKEPASKQLALASGQSTNVFSGLSTTSDDATTTWNIALKSGTTSTYVLSYNTGTLPAFRAARSTGADATTQITVTKNATLATFSSTGGTPLSLLVGSVVVGDEVRIGSLFNAANRGKFKVLAATATSFTIKNDLGQAEGPVTLGAGFADQISIYSAAGIQVGEKIEIASSFSLASLGTYEITDVSPKYVEFYSGVALPNETAIANSPKAFNIYSASKQLVYIQSDQAIKITINGSATPIELQTYSAGTAKKPGTLLLSAVIKDIVIENPGSSSANIFYVTAE